MPATFLAEPTPHAEAAKWLRDKPVVSREIFDSLLPELRARAFLVSNVEDANVAAEIREIVAKLPEGLPWEKAKREIAMKLGPWLSTEDDAMRAAKARAELILRTHGFQAYQVTAHKIMRKQEAVFPFWQYLSLDDEKVRPAHAALNLKIAPANAPFWHDHSPPWQWGCRCRKVPLLQDEKEEAEAEDKALPPERRRVLQGAALKLAEQGRLYNAAGQQLDIRSDRQRGKPGGFVFDPDSLALPLTELKDRYDMITWAEFETHSKATKLDDGRTLWAWLNGAKAKAAKSKPAAHPQAAAASGQNTASKAVSAALDLSQTGKHAQVVKTAAAAIDSVHDDGVLPTSLLQPGTVNGLQAYGSYHPVTNAIEFAHDGDWPELTVAHEVGHFLDRQALGSGPNYESHTLSTPEMRAWWNEIAASPTFQSITPKKTQSLDKWAYFTSPHEAWARSYAQFIAEESKDPTLKACVERVLACPQPWRQWQEAEFKPIANAIRAVLKSKGWIK